MQDHIIDENRPVQEFTVGDVPSYRVPVVAQQGLSGIWYARTKTPHPCPGNQPVHIYGAGPDVHAAVHQVGESVDLLNRMGCFVARLVA